MDAAHPILKADPSSRIPLARPYPLHVRQEIQKPEVHNNRFRSRYFRKTIRFLNQPAEPLSYFSNGTLDSSCSTTYLFHNCVFLH